MRDRVVQAAVVLVLMPMFEADFHSLRFAYRPKRNAHQAMHQIKEGLRSGRIEVINADLAGYSDGMPHARLLNRLHQDFRGVRASRFGFAVVPATLGFDADARQLLQWLGEAAQGQRAAGPQAQLLQRVLGEQFEVRTGQPRPLEQEKALVVAEGTAEPTRNFIVGVVTHPAHAVSVSAAEVANAAST